MTLAVHEVSPEEVMALLDGELPTERAAVVSRHVEECANCKAIQQPMRTTSAALAAWAVPEYHGSHEFERRLFEVARTQNKAPGVPQLASFFRRHWVLTAGTCAFAAFLVLRTSTRREDAVRSFAPPQAFQKEKDIGPVDGRLANDQYDQAFSRSKPMAKPRESDSSGLGRGIGEHAEDSFSGNGTLDKLETKRAQLREQGGDYHNWLAGGPMIARTVSLWIIAKDFGASRAALEGILLRHHGYAANLSVNAEPNAARSLQASLRIPATELGAVLGELKALGRMQNETQNGEEVTQQHADLVARLKNSRDEEMRLQDILRNRTGKIGDVLAVEQEIARVRGEIEQMEAEQKNLEHRVDFATVEVNLSEEYKAQLGTPAPPISTRFHNAVVKGIRGAQETIVGILLFFAEVGPSLALWVVFLAPAGWFLWRRWRRSYGLASSASL